MALKIFPIVSFTVVVLLFQTITCDNAVTPLGKFLYEDLKCSPIVDDTTKSLISYKCDVSAKNHCIFEGKKFEYGQSIKDKGTDMYCRSRCTCEDGGAFDCAEDDCFQEPREGCEFRDSFDRCCPELVCDPPKSNCTFEGKTYNEGASFYPKDQCTHCICQEGFKGKIEKPYCVRRRCLEQIFSMRYLADNCAAVYFQKELCCPATWICNENQKVMELSKTDDSRSKLTCNFGNEKVPYGYGFETTVRPYSELVKVRCECTLPPFVTCLEVAKLKSKL